MITYNDCSFVSEKVRLGGFTRGFLSEICPLNENEKNKWEIYEECKNILRILCSGSEYGLAVKYLVDRLRV